MKFFWVSAFIAFLQIIALAVMMKCITHRKPIPAILLFLAKAASYYFLVNAFVEKYIVYVIECLCGYLIGLTAGPVLLYLTCYFLYPLVIVRFAPVLWKKFCAIPAVKKVFDKIDDKLEGIKHRLGIGNQKGFKVKKVKF